MELLICEEFAEIAENFAEGWLIEFLQATCGADGVLHETLQAADFADQSAEFEALFESFFESFFDALFNTLFAPLFEPSFVPDFGK